MTMKRRAILTLAAALVVGVGVAVSLVRPWEPADFTTAQVVKHFREQTGEILVRGGGLAESWETLALDEDGSTDKYGVFTLYVVKDDSAWDILKVADSGEGEPLEPDEGSEVYWERGTTELDGEPLDLGWSAHRQFRNLWVRWQGDDKRETDDTWERLTGILEDLR